MPCVYPLAALAAGPTLARRAGGPARAALAALAARATRTFNRRTLTLWPPPRAPSSVAPPYHSAYGRPDVTALSTISFKVKVCSTNSFIKYYNTIHSEWLNYSALNISDR